MAGGPPLGGPLWQQIGAIDPARDAAMLDGAPGRDAGANDFNARGIGKDAGDHIVVGGRSVAHVEHVVVVHPGDTEGG